MKKTGITLLALTMLLAACESGNSKGTQETPDISPSPTVSAVSTPTAAPTPTIAPTPAPTQEPDPTPTADTKQYHMNSNYDIVPNQPDGNKKVVLLTFDDGPKEKEMNDALIATLKKHNAKAIFFLNGYRIKQKPELVNLLHDNGMYIGNHSWDHIVLKNESNAKIDQQVEDVQQIVKELIGQAPHFFRPPNGAGNDYLKQKVKAENMLYMTWSNGSLDWEKKETHNDPKKVIEKVLDQLHNGSNILMHELPWTVEALDDLLTQLEEKGFSFVDPGSIELGIKGE
ncbi:polysaccharide deacetylase family protein [Paenibacillus eucommiae]|uniref:Peptidoglycan/xylan/chitin deacetylase (PgdA/CDA1 family) n=1 Tax=Paenibacillus eucommiae TaxID=1355755 RepID=A0ABS4IMX7_9BACL|nr:polysaccharide deacetylase family protein [Paenibacillus eucommiae]MBP1988922.1 peptidoglycan/xylan/chitin deacetylase (PgdA/CDA1 family) [Paenibacillus eucommiae]